MTPDYPRNKISPFQSLALTLAFTVMVVTSSFQVTSAHADDSGTKYVEFSQIGDPAEVLEVKTEEPRPLEPGEIRVDVLASPIHPSNLLKISGNYGTAAALPSTPVSDGIGRVTEVSEGVSTISVDDLVLLTVGGTWRDEIAAPAAAFIPLPGLEIDDPKLIEQLSMTVINPLTAHLMLSSFVELNEGDWVVQSAANSAVGGYLVQLAKARGIKTVNVVRREGLAEDLMSKGATVVLIDGPDLADRIAAATEQQPVVLAIDAVGGDTFSRLATSLAKEGTLVTYGVMSGQPATFSPALSIFNDLTIRGFWLSKWFETSSLQEKQAALGKVIPRIASGQLKANIDSRFSVSEIKQAVTRAGQRGRNGKVLIVPDHQ